MMMFGLDGVFGCSTSKGHWKKSPPAAFWPLFYPVLIHPWDQLVGAAAGEAPPSFSSFIIQSYPPILGGTPRLKTHASASAPPQPLFPQTPPPPRLGQTASPLPLNPGSFKYVLVQSRGCGEAGLQWLAGLLRWSRAGHQSSSACRQTDRPTG